MLINGPPIVRILSIYHLIMLSDKFRTSFSNAKNQDGAQNATILTFFIMKRAIKTQVEQ
jgi:hypothetical protein